MPRGFISNPRLMASGTRQCVKGSHFESFPFGPYRLICSVQPTPCVLPSPFVFALSDLSQKVSFLGGPVWSQEMNLISLIGPLQLRIFFDSMLVEGPPNTVIPIKQHSSLMNTENRKITSSNRFQMNLLENSDNCSSLDCC